MQKVANILRKAWLKTDVYFNEDKLPKQFTYAESKNVQFAVFAWGDEETNGEVVVKNMTERTQENVKLEELVKYLGR
jgi:histidyl-tRNA synthetase